MIALLLTVGMWAGSGGALPGSDGSEEAAAVGVIESSGLADFVAESYARDYSVTVGEAGRRLKRIASLQEAMGSIRALEGSRVAGWGIDHGEDFGAWVWLAGDEDPGVEAARVAAAHDDVEIRTGATHTYAELQAAQDRINPKLVVDDPEVSSKITAMVVYTGIDMAANSVKIAINPGSGSGRFRRDATPQQESDTEGFAAEAAVLGDELQEHTGVKVTVTDASGFNKTANFRAGDPNVGCTAGFAAKQVGGPYGLLTAGHCDDDQAMHGVWLPIVVGGEGTRADAQLNRIPFPSSRQLTNDYVCGTDADSVCEVTGTQDRTDMMGIYVCHTGRNSGVSCGEITDITISPTEWYTAGAEDACQDEDRNGIACDNVFVEAHGSNLSGCWGDSGGPVYDANGIAYGILNGVTRSGVCNEANKSIVFSAIKEIENYLNVRVLTEPPGLPGTPQNLEGRLKTGIDGGVELTWTAPDEAPIGYNIYRRISGSGDKYEIIGTTHDQHYFDRNWFLKTGIRYQWIVRAVNNTLISQPSNDYEISVFTVENIRAVISSNNRWINVSWKITPPAPKDDIVYFEIYRRSVVPASSYKSIGVVSCCDYTDYITVDQLLGVEYLYRVKPLASFFLRGSWGSPSDYAAVRVPTAKPQATAHHNGIYHNGELFRGVIISWDIANIYSPIFEVYRRAAVAGQPYERINTTRGAEYYDPVAGLTPGMEYYYRIKNVNNDGVVGHWGSISNYAAVRLPALTGLQASVSSDSASITVTWAKPAGDVTRYEVYRRAAIRGQLYTKIGESTTTSYSDPSTGLVPGAEYYYRVKAVNAAGAVGSWGTGKNYARVVAPAVGGLKATAVSGGVAVSWEQSSGDVARYKVYRRVAVQGQAYAEIAETATVSYLDRSAGMTPGTEYYYRVKPVGASGVVGGWGPGPNYASIKYRR